MKRKILGRLTTIKWIDLKYKYRIVVHFPKGRLGLVSQDYLKNHYHTIVHVRF